MLVVLISFAIGLNYLYEHYKYNTVERNGKTISQPQYMAGRYFYRLCKFFTDIKS